MKVTTSHQREIVAKLSRLRQKIEDLVHPSEATKETALEALKFALSTTRDVADACNFAPLKGSIGALLEVLERLDLPGDLHDDLIAIVKEIERMLDSLIHYLVSQQEEEVVEFMVLLTSTVGAVRASTETKLGRGSMEQSLLARKDTEDVMRLLCVIGDTAESFSHQSSVGAEITKVRQELDRLKPLGLPFIKTAQYQAIANTGCTPGTCEGITGDLLKWSTLADYDERPVCWLRGPAGAGKTTIMYTISRILKGGGILGGTFFCSRDAADRRTITNIFPTIALSLAIAVPGFLDALVAALDGKKGIDSFTPDQQFEILIVTPARAALNKVKTPWSTRVVVIDALDECDEAGEIMHKFLSILAKHTRGIGIRFLVASRPELQFIHSFSGSDKTWSHVIHMQDIPEQIAQDDVMKFLISERARSIDSLPNRKWPTEQQLERLVSRSGSLFIYASTAWKYVSDIHAVSPSERLEELLDLASDPSEQRIDSMYHLVLSGLWDKQQSERDLDATLRCLRAIICLYEPLSIQNLSLLLDIEELQVSGVLDTLHSVIRVPRLDKNEPVTVFHASFANYLLDSARSGDCPWHVDVMVSHRELCLRCWEIMKRHLCFNISGSRSSYLSNEEQGRRPELSDGLVYACLRWTDHLSQFRPSLVDINDFQVSFSARFLYWIEVLSVLNCAQEGQRTLAVLMQCMRKLARSYEVEPTSAEDCSMLQTTMLSSGVDAARLRQIVTDTERYANEAMQFLIAFATPIAISAPHIYMSALACAHDGSLVQSAMGARFGRLPRISTKQARRTLPVLSLVGHVGTVNAVAFSPDAKRIVSASSDRTIRLWDPHTGTQVGQPLYGHVHSVNSAASSPDGKRVVSGSSDGTIRMWDLYTGTQVGQPLHGHSRSVWSVAFSPNNKRVVSGSDDGTVRMWDTYTGAQVGEPLRGHYGSINSVAFSPDGKRIISGSNDRTVRMWDTDTGIQIGEPLRSHIRAVNCVAFSPDGKLVASGSSDQMVRLWDADTGEQVGGPLRGHSHSVKSVAFSPDGKVIVSGSLDCTIRMWNPDTGMQVGEPLRCHDRPVHSIAYSPDGSRVASGSASNIISCWDMNLPFERSEAFGDFVAHDPVPNGDSSPIAPASPQSPMSTSASVQDAMSLRGLSPVHDSGLDSDPSFTLDQDGWIRGPNGELIFWVLPEYRRGLYWPGANHVVGESPVEVDFSGCPLGEDWTQCYQ